MLSEPRNVSKAIGPLLQVAVHRRRGRKDTYRLDCFWKQPLYTQMWKSFGSSGTKKNVQQSSSQSLSTLKSSSKTTANSNNVVEISTSVEVVDSRDGEATIQVDEDANDGGNNADSTCPNTKNQNEFIKQQVSSSFQGVAKMLGKIIVHSFASSDNDKTIVTKKNDLIETEEGQLKKFVTKQETNIDSTPPETFESLGNKLLQLVKNSMNGGGGGGKDETNEKLEISNIVAQVRGRMDDYYRNNNNNSKDAMEDPNSVKEILGMFNEYKDLMKQVASKYVGNIDFKKLTPTAILYYLEREDEIKNPSWKRRQHRFCPGIDISEVQQLSDACDIAFLSYADTVEEIREALLNNNRSSYELVFAELRSTTGKPASFVAVKHDQKLSSTKGSFINNKKDKSSLEVIVVVRGTKTAADAFTDLLCDSEPYGGGKAHSFIVTSGVYIAEKHRKLLLDLLEESGASFIDLTLIGHSLGAGAASIAAMEFNNPKSPLYSPKIKARVIGFGCPALVSEDLAKKSAEYITTVINDSDVVPRLSGISVANMLHNVLEFDWRDYAKKDLQCMLKELEKSQPLLYLTGTGKVVQSVVESLLEKYGKDLIETNRAQRVPVELFPPGKCLHFYNDGRGISASFVPNTFFNEIDVTRRMIDDHLFFTGYQGVFLAVARQHTRNHHFRFDTETDDKLTN